MQKSNDMPPPHLSDLHGIPAKSPDIRSTEREKRVRFFETDEECLSFSQSSRTSRRIGFGANCRGQKAAENMAGFGLRKGRAIFTSTYCAQTRETRQSWECSTEHHAAIVRPSTLHADGSEAKHDKCLPTSSQSIKRVNFVGKREQNPHGHFENKTQK